MREFDLDDEGDLERTLSDEDILEAMQHLPGYIDISTDDFRLIYHLAWPHACAAYARSPKHRDRAAHGLAGLFPHMAGQRQ